MLTENKLLQILASQSGLFILRSDTLFSLFQDFELIIRPNGV